MKKNMLSVAYSLAAEAFKDKVDRQGRPYFEHNSCITRLKSLTQKDVERTIKYHKTYQ